MVSAMKKSHLKIILALSALLFAGCQTPPPKPPSITQGIKLRDLTPADAAQRGLVLPSAVNVEVLLYSVPADQYDNTMRAVMSMLDTGPGMLTNEVDFRGNGFAGATGNVRAAPRIKQVLEGVGATILTSNYYSVFDERGDDMVMLNVTGPMVLPFVRGGQETQMTIRPGAMAVRVAVRRMGPKASVCKLLIQPVWKPGPNATFVERTSGVSRAIVYDNAGISMNMQADDLVVMAPASLEGKPGSLANVLMQAPDTRRMKVVIVMCTGITK
jgi:hypothetical protein